MKNPKVDAYISEAAPFAQPILRHLRALVHRACPEVTEAIKWSSPFFEIEGQNICSMAAFKEHCAFGFWHREMVGVVGRDGAASDTAMGSFGRITRRGDLPDDRTLKRYLKEAEALARSGRPAMAPRNRVAKPPAVPKDFAAALAKNKAAAATFKGFPAGKQKDYVEWIADAKREETRKSRLATAVEWLAEGKSRNWKYER